MPSAFSLFSIGFRVTRLKSFSLECKMTFIIISFTVANIAFKSGFLVFCSHV